MKKAKIMSLLLALGMTAALLGGCGSSDAETTPAESTEQEETSAEDTSAEDTSAEEETSAEATESEEATESYDYSAGLTEDGLFEGVTALDYVTLPKYDGIDLTGDIPELSEETLQEQVDNLLQQYVTYEEPSTEIEVRDGDKVNIDYVGSVDGVEFEGGNTNGEGTDVIIGKTSYIDDFLEQLIGHKPGETFDVEVTFPDPYENNPDLSGKDAVFVTTINNVQAQIVPELTDEFVAENLSSASPNFKTAEDVLTYMRDNNAQNYLSEYLYANSTIDEIPAEISTFHENYMINYYESAAAQYGIDLETYLVYFAGVSSTEELLANSAAEIEKAAALSLICQAIAEEQSIAATDEEVANYFNELGYSDYSSIIDDYGDGFVKMSVLNTLAQNFVLEHAVRE